jgi:hypothetical protein
MRRSCPALRLGVATEPVLGMALGLRVRCERAGETAWVRESALCEGD